MRFCADLPVPGRRGCAGTAGGAVERHRAEGILPEPGLITRAALFADRHLGKGDLTNGIYVDYGNMIPGAGWLSVGPGYKHWYAQGQRLRRRLRRDFGERLQDGAGPRRAAEVL